ncbi:hypothetical protein M3Y99_00241800 [Aphelenchoides fujianensis]|nr:hypothetical protein M3Y99_00241800 [Aphelenchoides fujianensis]
MRFGFLKKHRSSITRLFSMSSVQIMVEKTQRRIMGLFVMYFSHFTGLHPIRAPYFCDSEQCVKLSLSQRLSILDIVMWTVNLLVCLNHFYLHFFRPGLLNVWLSTDSVALLKLVISSAFPLAIMLISLMNSASLDHLLYLFSKVKREISASNNSRRIRKWRVLMFVLNALFMVAFVANLAVILLDNMLEDDDHPDGLWPLGATESAVTTMKAQEVDCNWCWYFLFYRIDDAYFEIMAFGVSEVPRIFIMMMTIELGFLFNENAQLISRKKLTKERLQEFHEHFHTSTTILDELEYTFHKLILVMVISTISIMTINFYVVLQYLTNINRGETLLMSVSMIGGMNRYAMDRNPHGMCHVMMTIEIFRFALKMIWTVGFIVACVWCNEKSRSALPPLLDKLAVGEAKLIKDQLVQKLQDYSWGITMGKFMRMERTVLLTMASVAFTVVVVWLQISQSKTATPVVH